MARIWPHKVISNNTLGYYNEARLLDPATFETVALLPNMPGSVISALAGRTYPLEGAAVLFPQYPPYTDPVTVLICGGSNFGLALDNCVSTQPEAENATWTLERMVCANIRRPYVIFSLILSQISRRHVLCLAWSHSQTALS